jgi:hypothetical protein
MNIRCGNKTIQIMDSKQANNLEVYFNLSDKGKIWRVIGDGLYNFTDIEVNTSQFHFLRELAIKHLSSSSFSVVM